MYKKLVEYVVSKIVDEPGSIEVTENISDSVVDVKLKVHASDLGKIIGKDGKTARSIRTLIYAVASKEGKRASFEILK